MNMHCTTLLFTQISKFTEQLLLSYFVYISLLIQ